MKGLLGFLFFIIFVFIVITLLCLLLPSRVTVTKSVDINSTPAKVRDQIINFENWKNWYPEFTDENISIVKNSPSGKILNSVTLSNKQGRSDTFSLVDSSKQTLNINLESGSSTKVSYQFIFIPKEDNKTQVTWYINTDMGWLPWKRIKGIFLDKLSGTQYQAALERLKKVAEN